MTIISNKPNNIKEDIIASAMAISIESGKLLEESLKNDFLDNELSHLQAFREIATNLKNKIQTILDSVHKPIDFPYSEYLVDDNPINVQLKKQEKELLEKSRNKAMSKFENRQLDNGGMAPPKPWTSIAEINLDTSLKNSLVEEMRNLKNQGQVIAKSSYHHKPSLSIEDFTESFKYMENMHDYNGSFLVTLLKSEAEINKQASIYQTDLTYDIQRCLNEEKLMLSIYDIGGSISAGEEKKFLIVLKFDKLHGILKYDFSIFINGEKNNLSLRQYDELEKFCKVKKINYSNINK